MNLEDYKQLFDILANEVNVKQVNIVINIPGKDYMGILYDSRTRQFTVRTLA